MTQIQVNYQNYLENQRHNREMEGLEYVNAKLREREANIKDYESNTERLKYLNEKRKQLQQERQENANMFAVVAKGIESLGKAFKPLFN